MDEMASVRTGQVVEAILGGLAGILTIIITSVIQIVTIKAMATFSKFTPETTTIPFYYVQSPYYPYFNSIQYKYVDYHHHQHSHPPSQVYHQVCQWRLVKESGPTKTIYRISSSSAATINTTQIIIIHNPNSLLQPILSGKETEERKNDRINIIRSL